MRPERRGRYSWMYERRCVITGGRTLELDSRNVLPKPAPSNRQVFAAAMEPVAAPRQPELPDAIRTHDLDRDDPRSSPATEAKRYSSSVGIRHLSPLADRDRSD